MKAKHIILNFMSYPVWEMSEDFIFTKTFYLNKF